MDECYNCGDTFSRIGGHWSQSESCNHQQLSSYQKEVLTGLLMGDGWVEQTGKNPSIRTKMISKEYLEYLDSLFPVYGKGVTLRKEARGNYNDIYSWHTLRSPEIDMFADWYDTGEKVWPSDISMTPTVFKHWYVGDGTYQNNRISIYMNNEANNTDKVTDIFDDANIPIPKYCKVERNNGSLQCSADWSTKQTEQLFKYMGQSCTGFDYKFP